MKLVLLANMVFSKEEKSKKVLRWVKTLFFLITMLLSLLVFSAPILVVVADAVLPSALLSASLSPSSLSLRSISSHLSNYDYRYSVIDIPLISIIRSAVILCVYSLCDGPKLSRGPYLGIATMFSVSSLLFVSLKASFVFGNKASMTMERGEYVGGMEVALFACSLGLAIGHIVVAYRTSCRERRKLLVYKIDVEAVSQHNPFFFCPLLS
ncbi:OLC1v1026786C1 [Oldenlandia corymbosa var. corymbosa]|uniref:OLC1v1026786C1 n=1 Tax=Oldenlandia corymbosa var. corymbosa TaxID=529605 RepID=A0AAV1C854_OLDCO|nr:OLC1v1026786C1 [Oldenlandia corymbosa var. corymbosa]